MKFSADLVLRDPAGEPIFDDTPLRTPVRLAVWLARQVRAAPAGNVGQMETLLSLNRKLRDSNGIVELDDVEEKALRDLILTFDRIPLWLALDLRYLLWPGEMRKEDREEVHSWYAAAGDRESKEEKARADNAN